MNNKLIFVGFIRKNQRIPIIRVKQFFLVLSQT